MEKSVLPKKGREEKEAGSLANRPLCDKILCCQKAIILNLNE